MNRPVPALALAILLGLSLPGCGDSRKGTPPPTNQPNPPVGGAAGEPLPPIAVLEAVPGDAVLVAGAAIAELARQPLVARAVGLLFARDAELEKRLTRLLATCEIDPARDVDRVVVGLGAAPDRVLMVASGRLAEPDLARCVALGMADLGGSLKTVNGPSGHTLYHAAGARDVYFAFLASGTVAVSASREWLEAALGTGDKVGAHPVLGPLLARARRDAGLWLVGVIPAPVGQALVGALHGDLGQPPTAFSGFLALSGGLDAELGLVMERAEDADAAVAKAVPQLALSALVAQRFSLGPVVNKIRVAAEQGVVYLRITLTETEVEETLARLDLIGSPGAEVDSEGGPLQDSAVRNQ